MITGSVNANREATIRLTVQGPNGKRAEIETVIDTGFNGYLTLPLVHVTRLELARLCFGRAILADGSEAIFDVYEAVVLWEGQPRLVEVEATESAALLGMGLLEEHTLRIDVVENGRVAVERFV
jgi:clan AA aspartic protease